MTLHVPEHLRADPGAQSIETLCGHDHEISRAYEKQLLKIREKIKGCIRALRVLQDAKSAGQGRSNRETRLIEGLGYWLARQSSVRRHRDILLGRSQVAPMPSAAPCQFTIRRFGPSSHERAVEPDRTRFTRDNPATWFSI